MPQTASAPGPTKPYSQNRGCADDVCGLDDLRCDVRVVERGPSASAREFPERDRLHNFEARIVSPTGNVDRGERWTSHTARARRLNGRDSSVGVQRRRRLSVAQVEGGAATNSLTVGVGWKCASNSVISSASVGHSRLD